jgi:DNA-binding HxlR family transcriptional regulator
MATVAATCGCGSGLAATDCLCPATPLAKLIGRRYALGLLSLIANHGTVRFNELRSRLGDVSSSTLATDRATWWRSRVIDRAPEGAQEKATAAIRAAR